MSKIVLIGDVHGKTDQYQKLLRQKYENVRTIQLGDMGVGFKGVGLHKLPDNHKWFRGNHDAPGKCRGYESYLGDYGYLPEDSLFWLAGAFSIDRAWRTEGVSWWPDEELSPAELTKAIELYKSVKPRFVLSHEAPSTAAKRMLMGLVGNSGYFSAKLECSMSRTAEALQCMFDFHEPDEWVFGHYHIDKSFLLGHTTFTCVAELSTYELTLEAV